MKFYALWISLICVLMFIIQISVSGTTEKFLLNSKSLEEPYRFITSIFLHASPQHLIFNMFALIFFGLVAEKILGSNKFLLTFLTSGIIANLFAFLFYPSSLGASGAIYGIIGLLTIIRPFMIVWAFSLPMPLVLASILWAIGDIIQTFTPSNIGTIAHLSGLAAGMTTGIIIRLSTTISYKLKNNQKIKIPEEYIREWERNYFNL